MTSPLITAFETAAAVIDGLPVSPDDYYPLSDDEALALSSLAASLQRAASTRVAVIAGDVARRSSRSLGHSGLAQRNGYRTPEELIRATTGSTASDAKTAVRIGTLMTEAAALPDLATGSIEPPRQPWMGPVASALTAGTISVAAASAIGNGLGQPSAEISVAMLTDAAAELCLMAAALDADRLYLRARELRDSLDEAGIADREAARRDARSLTFRKLSDGMSLLTWRLDPESAAIAGELYDRATSPRRGGPRFVDGSAAELASHIADDPRTTEQLASDTFLELLRHGADADSSQLLGSGAPVVRVVVTEADLSAGIGHGFIEGQTDPVSIETVERLACAGATQIVTFDRDNLPLDVGREQRLFSKIQRIALSVRDGGCMFGDCERPPSWTEAHHIEHVKRDNGKTTVSNGVLLCRHHHLLLHNNRWEIRTDDRGKPWLIPPRDVDASQAPRLMESKSRVLARMG